MDFNPKESPHIRHYAILELNYNLFARALSDLGGVTISYIANIKE